MGNRMKQRMPQASVLLEIPDCRMEASVTRDRDIVFNLGWPHDTTTLVFKRRRALKRFVRLAAEILTAPSPDADSTSTMSEVVSSPE
jgi:hypothetical protein